MLNKCIEVNHEQGSQEWLDWRTTVYSASQAASVVGLGIFWPKTPFELYQLRTNQKEVVVTKAMTDGNKFEPRARELLEERVSVAFEPKCYQNGKLSTSTDGVSEDGKVFCEIKTPMKGSESDLYKSMLLPDQYLYQMAQTFLVNPELKICWFTVYAKDADSIKCSIFERSDFNDKMDKLLIAWQMFHDSCANFEPPELVENDVCEVTSGNWELMAGELKSLNEEAKIINDQVKTIKVELIKIAKSNKCHSSKGFGVTVFKGTRKGSIDESKLLEMGIDIPRKSPTNYWSVR